MLVFPTDQLCDLGQEPGMGWVIWERDFEMEICCRGFTAVSSWERGKLDQAQGRAEL